MTISDRGLRTAMPESLDQVDELVQASSRRPTVYPARDMSTPLPARPLDAWFATISKPNG